MISAYLTGGRYQGKTTINIAMVKIYLRLGKPVVFAAYDQSATIKMLKLHFPNALFELVGEWGVKIHERRTD